jgi:hypothetical protein
MESVVFQRRLTFKTSFFLEIIHILTTVELGYNLMEGTEYFVSL